MKKILTGLALLVFLVPSITFAQTAPISAAYRASLEQLLQLLEQELQAILSAQPATTPATTPVATSASATSTITAIFTQPAQSNARYGGSYGAYQEFNMNIAVTANSGPVYIPLTIGTTNTSGVDYYLYSTASSTPDALMNATLSCVRNGNATSTVPVVISGNQYCLIEQGATGNLEATFDLNTNDAGTETIGINALNFTNNPSQTGYTQFIPSSPETIATQAYVGY